MSYRFEIRGEWVLDEREIWPDGDAPESPTVNDVLEVVRLYGPLTHFISDWNLYPVLSVDGTEVSW